MTMLDHDDLNIVGDLLDLLDGLAPGDRRHTVDRTCGFLAPPRRAADDAR
jgi:hypothetical protein